MVNKINVVNYKAFKDDTIELKPITIFLGANSVGKSSIIKLLLMISQSVNSSNREKSPLTINGEVIQLGSFENILHKKNKKSTLEIKFDVDNFSVDIHKKELYKNIVKIVQNLKKSYHLCKKGFKNYNNYFELIEGEDKDNKKNIDDLFKELLHYKTKLNNLMKKNKISTNEVNVTKEILAIYFYQNAYPKSYFNFDGEKISFDLKVLKDTYSYLENLHKYEGENVTLSYSFKLGSDRKDIKIVKFSITSDKTNIFTFDKSSVKNIIKSEYFDVKISNKYAAKFGKLVNLNQFQIYKRLNESDNFFVHTLVNLIHELVGQIKRTFSYESINYVDPLRAYPRRYYFLDEKENFSSFNKIDGEEMARILKDNDLLKKKVNKWIQKFKLKVDIEQLKETIHNIKISQNNLSLDITDVGFGISQVLPIITQGFFAKNNSVTIIEQPEIHLHPKMQSELGDLFIEMLGESDITNKKLIIETHSEYLLKRLRRRISEGKIKNSDVAIYSFSLDDEKNLGEIKRIDISERGAFEWPKDFYDVEVEDTVSFFRNQGK